jgi:hypothetical protein
MAYPKSTQELLEKYWAAETTPEEEQSLRASLQSDDKSVTAAYFRFLQEESALGMSAAVKPVRSTRRIMLKRVVSIAAVVLVLVTAGFVIQKSMITDMANETADSYDDPQQAYEETKQALLFVSAKMKSSREAAREKLAKTEPYIDILK